ncbi:MAG: ribonuclease P protein component [Phycisphaerales bacterium]|nr:ribonuclease P protein component [Phycisphaerales bacterium]
MESSHDHKPVERLVFRRRHRLSGNDQFAAVFNAKIRKSRGPMTIFLMPNSTDEHRLGLSIGRKAGNAVRRGRFKRIIREVFRIERSNLPKFISEDANPGFYDIVVSIRRHDELNFKEYRQHFVEAVSAAHRVHLKRMQYKKTKQDNQ